MRQRGAEYTDLVLRRETTSLRPRMKIGPSLSVLQVAYRHSRLRREDTLPTYN